MNLVKIEQFGEIEAIKLGYGPVGPPFMSVYLYIVGQVQKLKENGFSKKEVFNRLDY